MKRVAIRRARPLTLMVALGLALQVVPGASAEEAKPSAGRHLVQTKALVPENANTAEEDRVRITVRSYSDGSAEVTGSAVAATSGATKQYSFDLAKGTYKVTRTGEKAAATTAAAGVGHVSVHVMVVDPPQFVLAQNHNELWWNFGGPVVWPSRLVEWCSASAPSQGNTDWKVLWCDTAGASIWNGGTRISNTARGVYENWDWLWDDVNTQSEISSTITGRTDGRFDWGWTYRSWGESAMILQGKVILTT